MSVTGTSRHWHRHIDANGIYWLLLDKAESSANTLSREVLEELDHELSVLLQDAPRGLIIKSAKPSGFVLGADVGEFKLLDSADRGAQTAARGQALMGKLAELPIPTVAAIKGFALGGGLELALACDYRVAVESHERTLGLPEVQLGIHPGFGGTVRAVELLGPLAALDLMLTGRSLSPVEARSVGLVDRVVSEERLDQVAAELVQAPPPRRRAPWHLRALNAAPLRPWLARSMRARIARHARPEHYPAPYALLELWVRHGARGQAAYRAEAESIGRLLVTSTCRNLVRVFFLRERLRNLAPKEARVERIHVVGAGVMGGDIAGWCALRGLTVSVQDRTQELVEPALKRARRLFERRLRAPGEAAGAMQRLVVDLEAKRARDADVIIEAIVERLDAKRQLLQALEPKLKSDAILATNTSSIKLEEMAQVLTRPERFVGLHFFNPVARLPLVEVIRGADTADNVMRRALSFVVQIGKLPLPCRSAPGFVVNRVLAPYMIEALHARQEGYALETIDRAAENFGMPVGPVELADRVGLDVALDVTEILQAAAPEVLRAKVEAGELGVKSGRGFYRYEKDRPRKARSFPPPDADLQDRLILALVNEAMACYEDGVVEDPDLLDAGVVFGTGFAPFTGGPVHYARERGADAVAARLEDLSQRFGTRFTPHPGWRRLAQQS